VSDDRGEVSMLPGALSVPLVSAGTFVSRVTEAMRRVKHDASVRSDLGLLMTIGWLVCFSPLIDGGTTQLPVLVIRSLLLLSAVMWLLGRMREGVLFLPQTHVAVSVAVFCGWAILSLAWSPYKNASVQWIISILSYAVFFLMVTQGVRLRSHLWALVLLVTGVGVVEGLWGISQYLWFGEPRARGTFFNPNFFAVYEAAVFVLSVGILLYAKREALSVFSAMWLSVVAAVSFAAFVTGQSRGAALALAGALSYLVFCRYRAKAVAILALCLLGGVLVPNPLQHRLLHVGSEDAYAYTRIEIWKISAFRLLEHPLGIGVGMYKHGSFQERFPIEENIVRYGKRPESAHNEYLQMGVELGIIGLLVFIYGLWRWSTEVRQHYRGAVDQTNRALVMGLTASTLVLLLHAAVDSTFHEPALVIMLVLMAGLAYNLAMQSGCVTVVWRRIAWDHHPLRVAGVVAGALLIEAVCVQSAAAWYAHEEGKHFAAQDKLEQAMSSYVRAAAIDPGTTGYHDSIARTALQLFDQTGSSDWLLRAAEEEAVAGSLNHADARFAFRLGTIYRLMADQPVGKVRRDEFLEKAAEAFTSAIRLDPFSPFSYYELAKLHVADGRMADAIALLTVASGYEPNFLPGRALLAELCLQAGRPGDYRGEYAAIKTLHSKYRGRELNDTERRFLDVDLYPLGRALALETGP
jgi:O-antigen ligase